MPMGFHRLGALWGSCESVLPSAPRPHRVEKRSAVTGTRFAVTEIELYRIRNKIGTMLQPGSALG